MCRIKPATRPPRKRSGGRISTCAESGFCGIRSSRDLRANEVRFSGGAMPRSLTILRFHSAAARCLELRQAAAAPARPLETLVTQQPKGRSE